ncbi:MAG: gamma-glutamyl-gamma-aminobutyrate hydrolase family protein [Planctomycetota bacterium]|nr:gamma-glutamyl-gamma-aminobutyrate hydrolase family protein [Planctomycetota bacterium]
MIRIGLTACFLYPEPNRRYFGPKTLTYMENDLVQSLSKHGVLVVLIPDVNDQQLDAYLNELDGMVFQGGSDLAPQSYGEDPINPSLWPGDRYRDRYEFRIMDRVCHRKIPVLGICRGAQLINVWAGGTLYQDLSTQRSNSRTHRCPEKYDRLQHPIECTPGGLLNQLYGKTSLKVNSVHHQGLKNLGRGLKTEAICPDDQLVEAFTNEKLDEHYILGVQWHPEFSETLGSQVEDPGPLLDHFLKIARSHRS